MDNINSYLSVITFCELHEVEPRFIEELAEQDLIQIQKKNEERFIEIEQIPQLERMIRLRFDLDINPAGIDVITNLLEKMERYETEIRLLKSQLNRYI